MLLRMLFTIAKNTQHYFCYRQVLSISIPFFVPSNTRYTQCSNEGANENNTTQHNHTNLKSGQKVSLIPSSRHVFGNIQNIQFSYYFHPFVAKCTRFFIKMNMNFQIIFK